MKEEISVLNKEALSRKAKWMDRAGLSRERLRKQSRLKKVLDYNVTMSPGC